MSRPKILFMGTPEFAIPSLERLTRYEIVGVVTGVDKPKGRGLKLSSSPVKQWAEKHGIRVLQPQRLKESETIESIRSLEPDYIVVASYGRILPPEVLKIPRKSPLNVHPSLLPKYRGAAPVQWTLINGEKETGVTIFEMDEGMDTGRILYQVKTEIAPDENAGELLSRLARLGADALVETIELIEAGRVNPIPQNHSEATYARLLKKEDGRIDWSLSAIELHNRVRGMNPWPGCYTYTERRLLKIWRTSYYDVNTSESPGTVVEIKNGEIFVQTGNGVLIIKELQLEGKRRMSTKEFLLGHSIKKGDKFGDRG